MRPRGQYWQDMAVREKKGLEPGSGAAMVAGEILLSPVQLFAISSRSSILLQLSLFRYGVSPSHPQSPLGDAYWRSETPRLTMTSDRIRQFYVRRFPDDQLIFTHRIRPGTVLLLAL